MNKLSIHLTVVISLLFANFAARGAAILEIINPNTSGSTLSVVPGSSFNAEVYVTGLTMPLDSFDLDFASSAFSDGSLSLTNYTDTVPTGWVTFPLAASQQYGANNFAGADIIGSGELVLATFQTTTAFKGTALSFAPSGLLQQLYDSSGTISYTPQGLTVNAVAAPEPESVALLVGALLLLAHPFLRRKIRALHSRERSAHKSHRWLTGGSRIKGT